MKLILFALMLLLPFTATYSQDDLKARAGASQSAAAPASTNAVVNLTAVEDPQPQTVTIQAPTTTTVDYSNPDTFFTQGYIGFLKAALLALASALGLFIPGLRNVAAGVKGGKIVSSIVVALVALSALVVFRQGAFTENLFAMLTKEFLPNYGYASGIIYPLYKVVANAIKGKKPDK